MATKIGANGLLEADLIIPQGTTFACVIEHTDADGTPIDHSGCTAYMRIIDKNKVAHDLGNHVSFDGGDVLIDIPPDVTSSIALGGGKHDLMIKGQFGDVVRLIYGSVSIVDTYAMDE